MKSTKKSMVQIIREKERAMEGAVKNANTYETLVVNERGEAFGLIGLTSYTLAYQFVTDKYYFTIGHSEDEGEWVCQIDDMDGGCCACWQGATPMEALENACCEMHQSEAFRNNDNCEDAVNEIAYEAYKTINGGSAPDSDEELEQLDRLMGQATYLVKRNGKYHGIEWVEYQACAI